MSRTSLCFLLLGLLTLALLVADLFVGSVRLRTSWPPSRGATAPPNRAISC